MKTNSLLGDGETPFPFKQNAAIVAKITTIYITTALCFKQLEFKLSNLNMVLILNLQLRNCLNWSWVHGQTVTDAMEGQYWLVLLSAVWLQISGVDTGQGYEPKDKAMPARAAWGSSYQEITRAARCALCQALSIWLWEYQYPCFTDNKTEILAHSPRWPDPRPKSLLFYLPLTHSTREKAKRDMGLEGSMSPSHHIGSKYVRVLNLKYEAGRDWGGGVGEGNPGLWLLRNVAR